MPEAQQQTGTSQDGEQQGEQQGAQQPARTFTQEDVDRIVQGRLSKYADYDDLRAQLDEHERNSQTEQERAVSDARKEARREALSEANSRLIRAEARGIAADLGFLYPADAHRFLDDHDALIGEDGDVSPEAVEAALKAAVEARPGLVRPSEGDDGNRTPAPSDAGIGTGPGNTPPRSPGDRFAAIAS